MTMYFYTNSFICGYMILAFNYIVSMILLFFCIWIFIWRSCLFALSCICLVLAPRYNEDLAETTSLLCILKFSVLLRHRDSSLVTYFGQYVKSVMFFQVMLNHFHFNNNVFLRRFASEFWAL